MAPPWLRTLHNAAGDFQVLDGVDRAPQVSATTVARHPTNPLRRVDHSPLGGHGMCLTISTIRVTTNVDVYVRTIGAVLCRARCHATSQTTVPSVPRSVATTFVVMPSCCLKATSIVLCPVQLSAAAALGIMVATRVTIATDAAIVRVGVCDVEIVVDTIVGLAQIHVPRHSTTREIKRCSGTNPSLALNSPPIIRPSGAALGTRFNFFLEVGSGIWAIFHNSSVRIGSG